MSNGELGDSEGERRRIEMACAGRTVVSLRRWERGFRKTEGIEWERVGHRLVGGSYLPILFDQSDVVC